MSGKLSKIMIIAGAVLILAACGLMIFNKVDDQLTGNRSQDLLEQLEEEFAMMLSGEAPFLTNPSGSQLAHTPPSAEQPGQSNADNLNYDPEAQMQEEDDDGEEPQEQQGTRQWGSAWYSTLGIIQIPAINLKLPVINECSDALLNVAPCRLAGSANFRPRRLIIAGHNLQSHFKGLINLSVGDEMTFTSMDGSTYLYKVVEIGQCHRDNPEEVSAGEGWDITLVTCKTIRTMRTLVRFKEIRLDPEPTLQQPQEEPAAEQAADQAAEQTAQHTEDSVEIREQSDSGEDLLLDAQQGSQAEAPPGDQAEAPPGGSG
ncbi:MAG: sortase [Oscillospiraceae bacterium]|nr:sortase [Oscillospiraceae bacterium]